MALSKAVERNLLHRERIIDTIMVEYTNKSTIYHKYAIDKPP